MTPEEAIKDLKYDNERCLRICEGACKKKKKNQCNCRDGVIERMLDELLQYRKIGTVEECWEAVERLEAKPVKNRKILRNFHGNPYGIQGDCPNCGCERITSMSTDWCHVCGQHLKYDENLEGMEGGTGQV